MSVEINRSIVIPDFPEKGGQIIVPFSQEIREENTVILTCDSPTCHKTVRFVQEEVNNDVNAYPDDAVRYITVMHYDGRRGIFCGWDCLRRSMKDYVAPLSPREKAAIMMNNAQVAAKKSDPSKIHLVQPQTLAEASPHLALLDEIIAGGQAAPSDFDSSTITPENMLDCVNENTFPLESKESSGIQTTEA